MLPNGRQVETSIEINNPALEEKVKMIHANECRLTSEILATGVCSFAIEHRDGDFDIELSPNSPKVIEAITKLILRFDQENFNAFLAEARGEI